MCLKMLGVLKINQLVPTFGNNRPKTACSCLDSRDIFHITCAYLFVITTVVAEGLVGFGVFAARIFICIIESYFVALSITLELNKSDIASLSTRL